ncbi:TPA: DUF1361 domain-containing protein [Streptococcus suis]|uniref:DUF1361 domain-containing protein n=1 Tax=Streptococcus suis TaxID=1307 RepID=UPI002119265F|nr:DUF1361 domain-containing protein [Streptococcus suis]NRG69363.1 DUF1361 domain-containing protein [Streptococcus suis]HEL2738157.1 DUF1361 domain-containing protein [Streptococcus suis]HEM6308530.1 DUF1361 domain-containing protein [Streptococcus suis]HEM6342119.1 DUF1361 domain-containing protein [Streptococcus suis]
MFTPKNLLIHLFFVIICVGMLLNDVQNTELIWNMFWALIALDFAILVRQNDHLASKLLITPFWLFFYPNTFYVLTELVNIQFSSTALWERSSLLLFMLYIPSILFGIMAGVESLEAIFKGYNIKFYGLRLLIIGSLSLFASYAIYIGRYANIRSWDIFIRPVTVFSSMISAITWDTFPFIFGFTLLQIMVLVFAVDE